MGVNLGELVEAEEISFAEMNDNVIAVDAMNTLYQFLSIIRQRDGTPLKDSNGNVTSHLSGLFYRTTKLFEKNIKVVYVYDGKAPDLKAKESKERRKRREEAREEWKRLKDEGKMDEAYTKATQSSKIDGGMIDESKKLLDAMGVPWVQAPSEGEAQAAHMNAEGLVWAAGSQDWDLLLFGADRMVKNLAITGRRKVPNKQEYRDIVPEKIEAAAVWEQLGISREQLVWLGLLVGTDYNPGGVEGLGPKRGLDLVKQYDTFEALQGDEKFVWEHDTDPEKILAFFMDPPVDTVSFEFAQPDPDAITQVLVADHDFSEDRVESKIADLVAARQERQTGLGAFTQ